jgi:hypothetical protein
MKSHQRAAMRQKAQRKWRVLEVDDSDDFQDAVEWQEGRMNTWNPTPAETGNTPEYFAANPSLPF